MVDGYGRLIAGVMRGVPLNNLLLRVTCSRDDKRVQRLAKIEAKGNRKEAKDLKDKKEKIKKDKDKKKVKDGNGVGGPKK